MGEYWLDSIATLPFFPCSYGKPSNDKKPLSSIMTCYGTLFQSSIPLEDEREEQAIRHWVYRGKEPEEVVLTATISPEKYGKRYEFLTKMGYPRHGPLSDKKHALIEPMSYTTKRKSKDKNGLGFSNTQPIFDLSPEKSESKEETLSTPVFDQNKEKKFPSTTILWNEEGSPFEHDDKAPTSHHSEESEVEDHTTEHICKNMAWLLQRDIDIDL